MNLLPVIERELRAQARQEGTYWLRWASALPLVGLGLFFWMEDPFELQEGGRLFKVLQCGVLIAIWALVPAMVADTISRERREGTLHLLFLTPLRTVDVVLAKGFANSLRSAMLISAALPIMVVPFLLGGVDWQQAVFSVSVMAASFVLAVACGLLASSRHSATHRSLALAYVLTCLCVVILFALVGLTVDQWGPGPVFYRSHRTSLARWISLGWVSFIEFKELQSMLGVARAGGSPIRFWGMISEIIFGALMLSIPMVLLAGHNVRRYLLDPARSRARERLERTFFTPRVALGFYRAWMRRKLERNPVGWLEQRTWQARLISWSWFSVLLSIYSMILSDPFWLINNLRQVQGVLGALLLFSISLTASGSFRRERETGVLEILLVSPLSARNLVLGRLKGIWGQFMPALVLFLGVWIYLGAWQHSPRWASRNLVVSSLEEFILALFQFAMVFAALPVAGLYWSLRTRHYLSALIATLTTLALQPVLSILLVPLMNAYAMNATDVMHARQVFMAVSSSLPFVYWGVLAMWLGSRLVSDLDQRRFLLQTG